MLSFYRRLACASVIALPVQAWAWGAAGHESIGAIADALLEGTNAAAQVHSIVGEKLATAVAWADCAKGAKKVGNTIKYTDAGQYPECAVFETSTASTKLMVAFVKRNWDNCDPQPGQDPCHKQYHYTDVAVQHDAYQQGLIGTSDHDIVAAISGAIAVLQDSEAPEPFNIANKREALRMLAHYIGDIHQPLHVASVYLDEDGELVDPDSGVFDHETETRGGNSILHGTRNLHSEWDNIPASLNATRLTADSVLDEARAVPITTGELAGWSTEWATDTIQSGKKAFSGLTFSAKGTNHKWNVTEPNNYNKVRRDIQREQLIKAGARFAQLLQVIWP